MGRDYVEGKFCPPVLPKRPCLDQSIPMDVGTSDGGNRTNSGAGGGGGGGGGINDDVLFYVGKRRQAYNVSAESLTQGSAYFKSLLQGSSLSNVRIGSDIRVADVRPPPLPPILMDCEESTFESLLLLIRYGTWEALPLMSAAEIFRLKREAQMYGVQYNEPPTAPPPSKVLAPIPLARSSSADQSILSTLSPATSRSGSPKSDTEMALLPPARRRLSGCTYEGAQVIGTASRRHLAELPDLPLDLSEPAKLVLVSCLDVEKAPIYTCAYCSAASNGGGTKGASTQWALSFHYRHAFCASCGRTPAYMPPKHFAEMFTAAATHYHSTPKEQMAPIKEQGAWWVGCDSTCLLRFVNSACSGPDACRSAECAAFSSREGADTVWVAAFFYSHAFCKRCGQPATSPALVSLLLAIRYGGVSNKKLATARSQRSLTPGT